jgi:hypothetical protein
MFLVDFATVFMLHYRLLIIMVLKTILCYETILKPPLSIRKSLKTGLLWYRFQNLKTVRSTDSIFNMGAVFEKLEDIMFGFLLGSVQKWRHFNKFFYLEKKFEPMTMPCFYILVVLSFQTIAKTFENAKKFATLS